MSYDVSLSYPDGRPITVGAHEEGGTYVLGGSDLPYLNITYNYWKIYDGLGFAVRDLDGQRAGDTIKKLDALVDHLGTEADPDYWRPTEGNAGRAVAVLLAWARQHPDAVWDAS